jgi:hypothetical protein
MFPRQRRIAGGVFSYAIRVVSKESWPLVLPEVLVSVIIRTVNIMTTDHLPETWSRTISEMFYISNIPQWAISM